MKLGDIQLDCPLLEGVDSPADLKGMSLEELERLCAELRETILQVVSRNGGHLASNLGAVELTVALHRVFDAPRDRVVWDVGHQAYSHKLLTGRRELFHTLRRKGGLSGFPKREESPYDCFDVGHSGTSISAALGIARAMELEGVPGKVVAVIGDGSLTSGLALEGLNQAGELGRRLVVILNDNEMSISSNVGALSSYLSRLLTRQFMQRIRRETESLLKHIPAVGSPMLQVARRVEDSFKALIYPGMLFEELGYEYIGPIKGHRLDRLVEALNNARSMEGPVLVHVSTVKGKGYGPAEDNPTAFHGVGPFRLSDGAPVRRSGAPPSYTSVFSRQLVEEARRDRRIVAITAAMPEGTGLDRFARELPERFFDVGIAEQHAVTFAAGMATQGLKPVVAVYSTFLQRAYDQVVHDVCLQKLPVVFAMDRGGLVGEDGPTHHGAFDLSFLRHLPNMVLLAPRDESCLPAALATALACDCPAALRYPRGAGEGQPLAPAEPWEPGRGELLREGDRVALVGVGATVHPALQAARLLSDRHGIEAAVIDARFVKPLDAELIGEWGRRCRRVVTLEENARQGGFGSAVLELFSDRGEEVSVARLGLPDAFVGQGSQGELRSDLGLDPPGIARFVLEALDGGRR